MINIGHNLLEIFENITSVRFFLDTVYITFAADCYVDLNFVVDSSGSINYRGPTNWDATLQFIANVTRQFDIGPDDVQVAFVLFSDVATVEWDLTRYRDQASLVSAILNVRYLAGSTNLNDALYLTRTQVFGPGRGTRQNAVKASIIMTDGDDDVPEEGTPLTIQNATACKNQGIRLIVVSVTDSVNRVRLLQIVSSSSDYYYVDDFSALPNIVSQLRQQICIATTTTSSSTTSTTITTTTSTPIPVPSISDYILLVLYTHRVFHKVDNRFIIPFLPHDATQSAVLPWQVVRQSVRPSVCL